MEDLEEPLNVNWHPNIKWKIKDIKSVSAKARQWLDIAVHNNFDAMRQAIREQRHYGICF